ncbi:MAG: DegT/DnrJ/EryC1/StrS family aminotransferase [Burkholderiaceae bacterium]|jgi:dTDP-4-amino-4,6-dideoxygalactose transaminase|nr:DegT/DnrJ/EryC1/StrS family aminotransferase [Burkholderiaceae bacterium]
MLKEPLSNSFSPWLCFTAGEAAAVQQTLRFNQVNDWGGTGCRAFEKEFAEWVGTNCVAALANGTLALDATLKMLKAVHRLGEDNLRFFVHPALTWAAINKTDGVLRQILAQASERVEIL